MSCKSFALTLPKSNLSLTTCLGLRTTKVPYNLRLILLLQIIKILLTIYWKDQLIDFNCFKFLILAFYDTQRLFSLKLSLLWLRCWMGIMSAFLPTDKLEQGRHLQWREHLKIGESTIELWRSCFEFLMREVALWDMNCLLACWRFTMRRFGTYWLITPTNLQRSEFFSALYSLLTRPCNTANIYLNQTFTYH